MANIQTYLNNIKNALFGKDVRSSIHDGIDAINKEVENTTDRQVDLENIFDQLVINAGNSNAEIVDARVKNDGTSYSKLGDRLDGIDSQLAHDARLLNDLNIHKRDYINVKSFKCDDGLYVQGDGVHDDTTGIQNAINYCINSKNKNALYIGSGVFNVRELYIDGKLHLFGDSDKFTKLNYIGNETCLRIGNNAPANPEGWSQVYMHDFSIHSISRTGVTGIDMTRCAGSKFERMGINNFKGSGFLIRGQEDDINAKGDSVFNNIYIDIDINSCDIGFDVQGVINDSYFLEGQMNSIGKYGFKFSKYNIGNNIRIERQTCVISEKCIFIDNVTCSSMFISNCNFEIANTCGVHIVGDDENWSCGIRIQNNNFYQCKDGIIIDKSSNFIIEHNKFASENPNGFNNDISISTKCTIGLLSYNFAMYRGLSVDNQSKTTNLISYGYVTHDVVRNTLNLSTDMNFIAHTGGKGLILRSKDEAKSKLIRLDNTGALAIDDVNYSDFPYLVGLKGTTEERESLPELSTGICYFDTTLGKPVWVKSNFPTVWVDANGNIV